MRSRFGIRKILEQSFLYPVKQVFAGTAFFVFAEFDTGFFQVFGPFGVIAQLFGQQVESEVAKLLATMTARSPEALIAVKDFLRSAPHMEPRGMADYGANLLANVLSSAGK